MKSTGKVHLELEPLCRELVAEWRKRAAGKEARATTLMRRSGGATRESKLFDGQATGLRAAAKALEAVLDEIEGR